MQPTDFEEALRKIRKQDPRYDVEAYGFVREALDFTIKLLHDKISKLRELSPLWEMFKDGIDISTIQWAAH